MHIDGIQELNTVDGFRINLVPAINDNDAIIYSYDEVKKNGEHFLNKLCRVCRYPYHSKCHTPYPLTLCISI